MLRSRCAAFIAGVCFAGAATAAAPPAGATVPIDVTAIQSLATGESIRVAIQSSATPSSHVLSLSRFEVVSPDASIVVVGVDGVERSLPFDASDVVLLRGEVEGRAGSSAFLAVSPHGSRGRVDLGPGGGTYALQPAAGALASHAVTIAPAASGGAHAPLCAGCLPGASSPLGDQVAVGVAAPPTIRQIRIAVETDYEFSQLFAGPTQSVAYLVGMYGAISDVFARDAASTFAISFIRLWETPDDLFNEPGNPLAPFANFWSAEMEHVERDVAQFVSGRRDLPAGGSAYLNGICNLSSGYSWLGYVYGDIGELAVDDPFNRDAFVAAHELGHNAAALHTHQYGIDQCHLAATTPQRGTIMSYCSQTFTGGAGNSDMRFHTAVQDVIRSAVGVYPCLGNDCNLNAIPDADELAIGLVADVNLDGIPDECQDCDGDGVPDPVEIAEGAADIDGNGVPDACEPDCNDNGLPDGYDIVDHFVPSFVDDFESDRGWTFENLGAETGDFERGIPVNDPDWALDPPADADGSGRCLLTWNAIGPTVVAGGAVAATSPLLDLTPPNDQLRYARWLFPAPGSPARLRVQISGIDGEAPWTTVADHAPTGGTWVRAVRSLQSLGVPLSSTMRLRFVVDVPEGPGAEAGIDEFAIGQFLPATEADDYGDGVPDVCEIDCDGNGRSDYTDIQLDMSLDLDRNAELDSCQDCDLDGIPDLEAMAGGANVWIGALDQGGLRQYLARSGTFVSGTSDAGIGTPGDVRVAPDGRVLVTDREQHRVVAFAADGTLLGDLVTPGSGGLMNPGAIEFEPGSGNLLVASAGTDAVLRYAPDGTFIEAAVLPGAGGLQGPFGLARRGGRIHVTSAEGRVLVYNLADGAALGEFVTLLDNGGLDTPRGLLFLPNGDLLVASYETSQVLRYDSDGGFIGQFNQNGTETVLTLDQPWCIRLGPGGDVYVSRTHDHDEGGALGPGARDAALHLTNARIYQFDADLGFLKRAYVQGVDSGIEHPTGFDFNPPSELDCNLNLRPDSCDITLGSSLDVNGDGVPDECQGGCAGNTNDDEVVDLGDLLHVLANWGACPACAADVDGNGMVDASDLAVVLSAWGPCP